MNERSKHDELGPLGPALKWSGFSLPLSVHRRVLDFCARTGIDRDAPVHTALEAHVARVETPAVEQAPVERWTLFLPLELVNRLRICVT